MRKRSKSNGVPDVLANLLSPLGVQIMAPDDSDEVPSSCEDDSTSEDGYADNWIEAAMKCTVSSTDLSPENTQTRTPNRKRRRGWTNKLKMPYSSSMFYRDYHGENVQNVNHADAKEFRLNYRMPWVTVNKLVRMFVNRGWVSTAPAPKPHHMMRQVICPPEIKILGVLYWLGEGCSFRTIYNLSGRVLSRVSFTNFAKKFCHCLRHHLTDVWLQHPCSPAELREVSAAFAKKGFPGCCGSTDGVQIPWEGCPYAYRASFTGKEGYPTLGFNVTVAHDLRILHVCSMFAGRFNDKTKVLYDDYVSYLRGGSSHLEYETIALDGYRTLQTTPYLICDCGYHRWAQLMCPYKTTSKEMLALWSKRLESIRKDVEHLFGVLKKRFRVLKLPLQFREASFIENIFFTCCIFHNMLLKHDKQFQDGNFRCGVSTSLPAHRRRTILINNVRRLLRLDDDFAYVGNPGLDIDDDSVTEIDNEFNSMRHDLAAHTYYLFLHNKLIDD